MSQGDNEDDLRQRPSLTTESTSCLSTLRRTRSGWVGWFSSLMRSLEILHLVLISEPSVKDRDSYNRENKRVKSEGDGRSKAQVLLQVVSSGGVGRSLGSGDGSFQPHTLYVALHTNIRGKTKESLQSFWSTCFHHSLFGHLNSSCLIMLHYTKIYILLHFPKATSEI